MKPVRYDKVDVTAIGDIPIDLPEKNAIYKIQGRIPRFGLFTAECINMPLGRSTDLVLGADWLNENGFLDDIKKRLGMSLLSLMKKNGKTPLIVLYAPLGSTSPEPGYRSSRERNIN
jgi:hypothetical protein